MDLVFFWAGVLVAVLMFLSLYRAVLGPTLLDRLIGMNAIGSKTIALLLLIGLLYYRVEMFVDISLAYAVLNFIAVLAVSHFFQTKGGQQDDSPEL